MKVAEFARKLELLRDHLREHQKLWGASLDNVIPDYPLRNGEQLREQADKMARMVGALRPYIERFDSAWIMQHPGTGIRWDALSAATGLQQVAQAKGPSITSTLQKFNEILGRLDTLNPADDIPEDRTRPIRPGMDAAQLIAGYIPHLHPFIATGCGPLYVDGHYAQAVEEAAKAIFEYIRQGTGLSGDGAALAQTAFSVKKPFLAFSELKTESQLNEQVGFMEILCAFHKGVRHPLAHSHGAKEDAQKAFEYLVTASLLCRRIDDATPKAAASS